MCNQNSCFGGSSCCWIIIAIILLFLFCGNGCGNGCGKAGTSFSQAALRYNHTSIKTMRTSTAFDREEARSWIFPPCAATTRRIRPR